jgi:protein-arginine kinase activator protein McsA
VISSGLAAGLAGAFGNGLMEARRRNRPLSEEVIHLLKKGAMADKITCPQCGMTSYNPNDIRYRYCGNCHQFHDTMKEINE